MKGLIAALIVSVLLAGCLATTTGHRGSIKDSGKWMNDAFVTDGTNDSQ